MPYSQSLKNQIQIMPEDLTDNVLLFLAGEIPCAIPLLKIATVIRMIEITPLSECQKQLEEMFTGQNSLAGIVGCITYSGQLIPVYYLNAFFGVEIEMPALTDNLILVNAGADGSSMLSALWVKSIIGVYGRDDLFRINKPENHKADSENKENCEEKERYIDSEILGLKIYSGDLESLILIIEDPNKFILHGSCGGFNDIFHLHVNKNVKKRQFLNDLLLSKSIPEPCADIKTENSGVENILEEVPIEILAESLEGKKAAEEPFVITIPESEIRLSGEESSESEEFKKIKVILKERRKQIEQPYEEVWKGGTVDILRFRLMYREYAFVMKYIREVLIYDKLTPVPGTPDYIPGIFALRGEIISLVDLRKFFSLQCSGLTDLNLVIILTDGEITFGILADYITDIGTIPLHRLKAPDDDSTGISSKYIKGIVDNSLIVLDAEALLLDPDMIVDEK